MADSTTNLETIASSQSQKEVTANALFDAMSPASMYGRHAEACTALTWGYYGGRWGGSSIANGTISLVANTTNYIVANRTTGAVSLVDGSPDLWADTTDYMRLYSVVAGPSTVTSYQDHRMGPGGVFAGAGGGAASVDVTVDCEYLTDTASTTDSDPGPGNLRWNNATQASATVLYIDNSTSDGVSLATLFASLTVGSMIYLQESGDGDKRQLWKVTATPVNGTGYYKFTVALQAQEGTNFADDTALLVRFDASGASATLANWTDAVNTASPNGTVPAASLTPSNAATNVDAVLAPKGTGAVLAQVPDSTATGGNKRGTGAVDLQTTRTASTEVASGTRSVVAGGASNEAAGGSSTVGGGASNEASGASATVAGGSSNTANNNYTTVGGGQSNTASGAASAVAGGQSNNASGDWSCIPGGQGNTASGSHSHVPGGEANTASGAHGTASGQYALDRGLRGARAHAAGRFSSSSGSAQWLDMVFMASTSNATPTVLTVAGGAASAINQLVLTNSMAVAVRGKVVVRQNSTGDCKAWSFEALIRRGGSAAATALVAAVTPTVIANDAGAATWALAVTADTTNGGLALTGTGEAAKDLRWVAHIDSVQVFA